jgi:heme oxygenase (staphylobilin-producing)
MFIAINNLIAKPARGGELETRFAEPRGLERQPGFLGFELLKRTWAPGSPSDGGDDGEHYIVMTRWDSAESFLAWTRSDAFKQAHAGGRPDFLAGGGHPAGYDIVLSREPDGD